MKKILSIFGLLFITLTNYAQTYTTTNNGDWTNTSTWGGDNIDNYIAWPEKNHVINNVNLLDDIYVEWGGVLNIGNENGTNDTLVISGTVYAAVGSVINVFNDGVLIIETDVSNTWVGTIQVTGKLVVKGNFFNSGSSAIAVGVGGTITVEGDLTNNGSITNNGTFNVNGTTSGTGSVTGTPLPIELIYFNSNTMNTAVQLNWATATEENNQYFEIQRATDAVNYTTIARIDGAGNSQQELLYSYTDKDAPVGLVYYRLKQVDFNGASETFDPVAVNVNSLFNSMSNPELAIYPNPYAKGDLTLELTNWDTAQDIYLNIFSITGQMVYQDQVSNLHGNQIKINEAVLESLPTGAYLLECKNNDIKTTKQIMIQ